MIAFPLRAKLLAGFALNLLLICLLSFVAWQLMGVMQSRAAFVNERTIPSLGSVAAFNTLISRYRVQQLEYLLYQSSADKDRIRQQMAGLETEMAAALDAYRPFIDTAAEAQALADVESAWAAVVEANYTRFLPAVAVGTTGSVQPFYSRMNPLYQRLDSAVVGLTAVTEAQAADALSVARGAYDTARSFIVTNTLLAVIISGGIGLILSGRIARRVGRLTTAADRVAVGDLAPQVEVTSNDELGRLAQAFNQMIRSLREQRGALQQQNAALQTSLDRQEQLMDELRRGKLAEAEAYSAQAAAEAASQAKSMFLATMSHELRTPLNAILGYAQLLRLTTPRRAPVEDAEAPDPLDRILAAGRHLTAVISDVLDFSKIEQGRLELNLTPVSLCGLAREALDVVQPLAERQHNRLLLRCDPELGSVLSDADKLRQVLLNLLSNAAKFTEHGEIVLRVWREAPAERGQRVRFAVSDTGIGIAPEQFGRLFQPFSQLDASVTRRYEGTGLGLALSRQICLALGGDISVISTPGRGSTFTVDLPATPPQSLDQREAVAGDELLSAIERPLQPAVT